MQFIPIVVSNINEKNVLGPDKYWIRNTYDVVICLKNSNVQHIIVLVWYLNNRKTGLRWVKWINYVTWFTNQATPGSMINFSKFILSLSTLIVLLLRNIGKQRFKNTFVREYRMHIRTQSGCVISVYLNAIPKWYYSIISPYGLPFTHNL